MRPPFLLPDSVTSFHDYFRLTAEADRVAEALGYSFTRQRARLPQAGTDYPWMTELQRRLELLELHVNVGGEQSRREFFIAPVLIELSVRFGVELRSEYPVVVSAQLQGSFDFFVQSQNQFLVVEAKQDNTARGMTQLVAEMAAFDQWTESEADTLYGALSVGTVWQFLRLHRTDHRFEQDVNLFRVPQDLPALLSVLMGILEIG